MSAQIPFDVLALIVQFMIPRHALQFALSCKAMKRKIDSTYVHKTPINLMHFFDEGDRPKRNLMGVFTSLVGVNEKLNLLPLYRLKAVKYLQFAFYFNQPVGGLNLPPSLNTLVFECGFNQPVGDLKFPESLHTLIFGWHFNQPVDCLKLPPSLHILQFGRQFNQPVDCLKFPPTLRTLQIGRQFKQLMGDLRLPESLHTLKFGGFFADRLTLPKYLHTLELGERFNRSIDHLKLPSSLRVLQVSSITNTDSITFCVNIIRKN